MRIRKPGTRFGLAFLSLLIGGALAVIGVWHYHALYVEAATARNRLIEAQDTLKERRLDATPEELAAAKSQFEEAETGFKSLQQSLRRDPLVRVASALPGLGHQVSAAENVLSMGRDASGIGVAGVAVAEEYSAIRTESESTTSEKAMLLLERVRPYMDEVDLRLSTLLARRDGIDPDGLAAPLREAIDEVDEHSGDIAELVDTYGQSSVFFPDFLGFNGPRTYLVLAQNNAELLPTGGLISVYGLVTLNEGRVEEVSFADAVAFGEARIAQGGEYVEPPAPLKNYLLKDWSWNLDTSNWSPDFPTAARQAEFFFAKGNGRSVDGVIGINVKTLEKLLEVTGPITVDEYGVTVDPQNVLEVTETLTRSPLEPGGDRKAFTAFLAEEMLHRLMNLDSSQWSPLLDTLEELRDEKTVLFYSHDPAVQEAAVGLGIDGALEASIGDYLMPVEASVNSTKLNIIVQPDIDVEVALDELGNAHTRVALSYENNLAAWEEGRDPKLVYKLMLNGLYGGYLRLFTANRSRLVDVRVDGTSAGADEVTSESGKSVFGRFFSLPKGATREVAFDYVSPGIVAFGEKDAEYRLFIQKQPGTGDIPLKLRLSLPEGAEAVALTLDGEPLPRESLEITTDLSRDREVVLTYHTGGER